MRLTADVILRAHVSINPLRERELNLRGYKAPAIENLGVTQDGFDCIDLSDNEIKKLENFPRLHRLRMLLLHNNHVSKIQEKLAEAIANLEFLMLTGNRITQLSEIDHLVCFTKLDTLSLSGNPVTKRKYYREYVIHKLPQLHVLDFQRIRPRDREAASAFFNSVVGQRAMNEAYGGNMVVSTQAVRNVLVTQQQVAPPADVVSPAANVVSPAADVVSFAANVVPPAADVVSFAANVVPPATFVSPLLPPSTIAVSKETSSEAGTPENTEKMEMEEPKAVNEVAPADIEMEDAGEEENAVSYMPPKPIPQMTVSILREELKKLGLSIKGLKAELVKRLKKAAGEA